MDAVICPALIGSHSTTYFSTKKLAYERSFYSAFFIGPHAELVLSSFTSQRYRNTRWTINPLIVLGYTRPDMLMLTVANVAIIRTE